MFKYPKYVRVPDLTKDNPGFKKQANGLIKHFFKKDTQMSKTLKIVNFSI